MKLMCSRQALTVLCCVALSTLVACGSKPRGPVPVEDRVAGQGAARQAKAPAASSPANAAGGAVSTPISMGPAMPGSENAGKPGYYSVRSGDTLTKIALDHGQAWRDIAKWNGLDNPNVIEVDQVLRVVPPVVPPVSAEAKAPATQRQASTAQAAQAQTTQQAAPQPTPQTAPQTMVWPLRGLIKVLCWRVLTKPKTKASTLQARPVTPSWRRPMAKWSMPALASEATATWSF